MSAYTTQAAIQGEISLADLIAALDDNESGALNVVALNQIIINISGKIDGLLAGIYLTPFNPVPSMVADAALYGCCYEILRRALTSDERNTFFQQYDYYFNDKTGVFVKVRDKDGAFDIGVPRYYSPVVITQSPLSVDMTMA